MRKLFLFLFIALFMSQAALAVTFDTVWVNHIRHSGQAYHAYCRFACFSLDTTKIIAAMDSTIYYLDLQTGNIIDSLEKPNGILADGYIVMSLNESRFASILWDGRAVVWEDSSKKIIKTFDFDTINYILDVTAIALSPDGRYGLFGASVRSKDPPPYIKYYRLLIYDLNVDSVVKWINGSGYVQYVAYAPDGNSFVVSSGGSLTKYSTNGWQLDSILENNSTSYYSYLSYSSDSKYLAGRKQDSAGNCYIWDNAADTLYKTYSYEKLGTSYGIINFSPDNQYLLFGGGYNGDLILCGHKSGISQMILQYIIRVYILRVV